MGGHYFFFLRATSDGLNDSQPRRTKKIQTVYSQFFGSVETYYSEKMHVSLYRHNYMIKYPIIRVVGKHVLVPWVVVIYPIFHFNGTDRIMFSQQNHHVPLFS